MRLTRRGSLAGAVALPFALVAIWSLDAPGWILLPAIYAIPLAAGALAGWIGAIAYVLLLPGAIALANEIAPEAWTSDDFQALVFLGTFFACFGAVGRMLAKRSPNAPSAER